jgi:TolB-like protein
LSFFNELKRRNVFRVGIAYIVVAWLVAQVLQLVFESFETPAWAIKFVLVLLATGFPFALFFAWAFELTPEGLKREHEVDRSKSITAQTGKRLNFMITTVMALALVYFAYDKFVVSAKREAAQVEAATQAGSDQAGGDQEASVSETAKSIAVLPFVNMSDDPGNEYFSDGISEEILNALAKVKELKVAGRTSSFVFKEQNKDLRQIGEILGVSHILEGSVRKAGDKVRITAQLIKVDDGFHLWSETYDRELTDVFAIQDEIANAILNEMKAALLGGEATVISSTRTDSKAYELYLLARQRMYEREELTLESAAELLDQAIAIDPLYAPAYAQRGIVTLLLSITSYGKIPQEQSMAQARLYLDKAIALDENLAEAWAGLGLYYNGPPSRPFKAIEVLEKALSINPSLIDAANWLVLNYWEVNRATESMALLDSIAERDPLYKPAIGNRVFQMTQMGRSDEARAYLDRLEPFFSDEVQIDGSRAWVDFQQGLAADGLQRMQAALQKHPNDRVYKVGVNWGSYLTHQYEGIIDDQWSGFLVRALFNLGRNEEALIEAQKSAARGDIEPLFFLYNASGQPGLLVDYFESRWPDLDAFQQDVPAGFRGYTEMAEIAYAYRETGDQAGFEGAMAILGATIEQSQAQGVRGRRLLVTMAKYHVMQGEYDQALSLLAEAVDKGMVVSTQISREYPFFQALDGHPEYEAIQVRMIEHLNRERQKLGLEPVSS